MKENKETTGKREKSAQGNKRFVIVLFGFSEG